MTDEEIAAHAQALRREHPDGATVAALKQVQAYLDAGDLETAAHWGRVAALVSEQEAMDATRPIKMII